MDCVTVITLIRGRWPSMDRGNDYSKQKLLQCCSWTCDDDVIHRLYIKMDDTSLLFSHSTKRNPKYPGYGMCHLMILTSFRVSLCSSEPITSESRAEHCCQSWQGSNTKLIRKINTSTYCTSAWSELTNMKPSLGKNAFENLKAAPVSGIF